MIGLEYNLFVWNRPPFMFVSTTRRLRRSVPSKDNNNCMEALPFLSSPITVLYLCLMASRLTCHLTLHLIHILTVENRHSPNRRLIDRTRTRDPTMVWHHVAIVTLEVPHSSIVIAARKRSFVRTGIEPDDSVSVAFSVTLDLSLFYVFFARNECLMARSCMYRGQTVEKSVAIIISRQTKSWALSEFRLCYEIL